MHKLHTARHARFALFAAGLVALQLSTPALAQASQAGQGQPSRTADEIARLKREALEIQAGGTTNSPSFGTLANAFQIETDGDDTNATLTVGFHRTKAIHEEQNGPSYDVTTATDSWTVTATAPIGKQGKPSIFDFDKLGDGTSLEFKGVRYWGTSHFLDNEDSNSLQAITNESQGRCIYGEAGKWVSQQSNIAKAKKINESFEAALKLALGSTGGLYDPALVTLANSDNKEIKTLAIELQSCIGANPKSKLGSSTDYLKPSEKLAIDGQRGDGLWFIGASAKIARANYEFVVQTPLGKDDVSHTGYKAQIFGGRVFASGNFSWSGGFAYGRSYKAADEVELCAPNGVGSQIACFTGPLGPPTQADRYTASTELRWRLALPMISEMASLGFAPRVSYEFKSDSALFEMPVYFAPAKGGKSLNGGLRFAYDTKDNDFAFGLFVGVPFSIFFN